MPYEWLDEYLLAMPGAEKDFKAEWNAWRYMLRGKMFAMRCGDKESKPICTFKLEPAHGELLRREYPGMIVPGYYMNKEHWNSLYLEGSVPDDVVRDMANASYRALLGSLSKKAQAEIAAAGASASNA